jgi:hypothetical protein
MLIFMKTFIVLCLSIFSLAAFAEPIPMSQTELTANNLVPAPENFAELEPAAGPALSNTHYVEAYLTGQTNQTPQTFPAQVDDMEGPDRSVQYK